MTGGDTIEDAIIAGSASGELGDSIRASRRKKRRRPSAFESAYAVGLCSNCGTKLIGPVCHSCGQTAETFHRPIWDLLIDVLDGLFGFDGRLWRTLPPLLFQPGKMTRRYLSGARARYVMPFRLYLVASVLFFLAVFAVNSFQSNTDAATAAANARVAAETAMGQVQPDELDELLAQQGLSEQDRAAIADGVARGMELIATPSDPDETPEARAAREAAQIEGIKARIRSALLPTEAPEAGTGTVPDPGPAGEVGSRINGVEQLPLALRERLADQTDRIVDDGGAMVVTSMQVWAPRLMFGLLPIYALLLAVTHFYKRGYFFYDHLVVSLHFHSVLFFGFMIVLAVGAVIGTGLAGAGFVLWANYYLYRLHRVVYRHGRFSSLLRTVFMDLVYGIILTAGMLILLIIGILSV